LSGRINTRSITFTYHTNNFLVVHYKFSKNNKKQKQKKKKIGIYIPSQKEVISFMSNHIPDTGTSDINVCIHFPQYEKILGCVKSGKYV
jgi:hypothetical protein